MTSAVNVTSSAVNVTSLAVNVTSSAVKVTLSAGNVASRDQITDLQTRTGATQNGMSHFITRKHSVVQVLY